MTAPMSFLKRNFAWNFDKKNKTKKNQNSEIYS